jgi:hypothetical protein
MKTLYKKAAHLRAHTWKDIGGLGGLLLNLAFFVFLLIVSFFVSLFLLSVGVVALVLDYVVYPLLALLSLGRIKKEDRDQAVLLEDGTLGVRPAMSPETTKTCQHA